MKCEICDTQAATMWVQDEEGWRVGTTVVYEKPLVSCDDCGPQLGYKILAPIEPTTNIRS